MPRETSKHDHLTKAWNDQIPVVRTFLENRPRYDQLGQEVAYILEKRLREAGIEFSTVSSRAKELDSFVEKLARNRFDAPLSQVTDLAGTRIVYLYRGDKGLIERLLEQAFEVVEKVDRFDQQQEDTFGYDALYYIVRLGREAAGSHYDDLKDLLCEVQVRTVLQDAWARVDEHLVYKRESGIPKALRRKLGTFAALFENADDQFDQIRRERELYKDEVQSRSKRNEDFLPQELNLDTLTEFLRWRFPDYKIADMEDSVFYADKIQDLVSALKRSGRDTLQSLNALLAKTEKARQAMAEHLPQQDSLEIVSQALALVDSSFRQNSFNSKEVGILNRHTNYVERSPQEMSIAPVREPKEELEPVSVRAEE